MRKRFGQHFLHDPAVIRRIVDAIAPAPDDTLIEIGPGRGALTLPLLERVRRLHVVELDRDLARRLADIARDGLTVHQADALRFDPCALAPDDGRVRMVGNLPYNISTPLLFHCIDHRACIADMTFMLQKEVVDRLGAEPGDKARGRLSVMIQLHCEVEPLFTIGPGAFTPPPAVDSAMVRLRVRERPAVPVADAAAFARVVAQAFTQRRKTLRNALSALLDAQRIETCGVDPRARAETLTLADFARLADMLAQ